MKDWLYGNGAVIAHIRAMDWTSTSLGPRLSWCSPLRTAVNLMLAAQVPTAIFWGEAPVLLYNDAVVQVAMPGRLGALGCSIPEGWPEIWRLTQPIFSKVMGQGETVTIANTRFPIAREGGLEDTCFSIFCCPIHCEDGSVGGSLVTFIETMQPVHRTAEAAATNRTRELFERTSEIAKVGGWELDLKTGKIFWSKETYRILEVDPSVDLRMEQSLSFYSPKDRSKLEGIIKAAVEHGVPWDLELPLTTARGRAIWVRGVGAAVVEDGKVTRLVGTFQDITSRKQVADALRTERNLMASFLETVPVGVVTMDTVGRVISANPRAKAILGLRQDDPLRMTYDAPIWRITALDGGLFPADKLPFSIVMATGKPALGVRHAIHCPDGRRVVLSINAAPVIDGSGLISRVIASLEDITELERGEAAILETSRRLELALRTGGLAVWDWNLKTGAMVWDDEMFRLFGVSREQFSGSVESWQQGLHPGDRDRVLADFQAAIDGTRDFKTELRIRQPGGSEKHVKASGLVLRDKTGSPLRMLGLNQDITDQRHAKKNYEMLFGEMLDGFALHEILCNARGLPIDYRFLALNPAFERMTGLKADAIVGRTVLEVMPGTEWRWIETYGKVALTGEPAVFENYATALDKHFQVTAFRPAPNQFACIFVDITERKQAEANLMQSEALMRTAIENLPLIFYRIDIEGIFRLSIGAGLKGLGLEQNQVCGQSVFEIYRDFPEITQAIRKALAGDTATFEVRVGGASYSNICVPFRSSDAGFNGLVGVALDITGIKKAEEEKSTLEARLHQAQKMESVGRLAGGVAHDFNNMLSVILGHVELAREKPSLAQSIQIHLEEIQKAAHRSSDLTRQLLAFARKQTVAPKVLDLNKTVESMFKMLCRLIGEDIDLRLKPNPDLWSVNMDPSQIDQILANLCVNARDAIRGVGKITIETDNCRFNQAYCAEHTGHVEGEYVGLVVSDTGCGMDQATLAQIFEPFFTTKAVGKGTGLGLSTVYGIVKQNKGFISVHSELGRGTTFKLYLPRHGSKATPVVESAITEATGGREVILLVEDEPAILRMTKIILERRGYTVVAVSSPSEAKRVAGEHPTGIHLLITDVVMPEGNGRDLAEGLLSRYPRLKILFMSGYTTDVIAHHGVLDKGVNFIQKPFTGKDLAQKVREALDG